MARPSDLHCTTEPERDLITGDSIADSFSVKAHVLRRLAGMWQKICTRAKDMIALVRGAARATAGAAALAQS
jgi:hypothetical protein